MTTLKLIYPALAMILWIFVVLMILGKRRKDAFAGKQVRVSQVSISTDGYPEPARLASANFSNQFETPVIFFALIMLAMHVNATDYIMAALAWAFVATRVVHTLVHTGSNDMRVRPGVFAVGVLILFCMWAGIVLKVV